MTTSLTIGVLALQGAFIEHIAMLRRLAPIMEKESGVRIVTVEVRVKDDLYLQSSSSSDSSASPSSSSSSSTPILIDGLIIPGGESTVILRLLRDDSTGLTSSLQRLISCHSRPMFGTCAGSILLANRIVATDAQGNDAKVAMQAVQRAAMTPKRSTSVVPLTDDSSSPPSTIVVTADDVVSDDDMSTRSASTLLGGMRLSIVRNYYGRQLASFQCSSLILHDDALKVCCDVDGVDGQSEGGAIFIRAPAIVAMHRDVKVLATLPNAAAYVRSNIALNTKDESSASPSSSSSSSPSSVSAVAVRDANFLATCFHPELSMDTRWHRYFVNMCIDEKKRRRTLDAEKTE